MVTASGASRHPRVVPDRLRQAVTHAGRRSLIPCPPRAQWGGKQIDPIRPLPGSDVPIPLLERADVLFLLLTFDLRHTVLILQLAL